MPIVTIREFTIDDLITEFEDTMARDRRTYCPITKKLKEKRAAGEWVGKDGVDLFEAWVFSHDLYAVPYICDVIRTAGWHHEPEIAAHVQQVYAHQLATYPWEKVRHDLEALVTRPDVPYDIDPEAMRTLAEILRAGHPNAKEFILTNRIVHERIPEDVDLSDFSCPDFPGLEWALVAGARRPRTSAPVKVHEKLTPDRPFRGKAIAPGSHKPIRDEVELADPAPSDPVVEEAPL